MIGLLAGGAVLVLMVVLLSVVVRVAARTAATAQAVLVALDELKANTAPLSDLDSRSSSEGSGEQPGPSDGVEDGRARRAGNGAGG